MTENLWDVEQAASFLNVPVKTMYDWSARVVGPPVLRIGRHLRYDPAGVREWAAAQEKASA